MSRRTTWKALVLLCAVLAPGSALAQFQPTNPIEFIVHSGPGGGNDLLGRAMVRMIEEEKLAPVRIQVVNKTGGGSTTAAAYMAGKVGDTHTIGLFSNVWLMDPLTQEAAKVSMKDLTPVARLILEPALIVVKDDAPYKTLKELVTAAKEKSGQLKQSGGSITSRDNIVRQLIMKQTGANWSYISFPSGGERLAALMGGHVDLMILDPSEAIEQIRSGKLRVLAQISEKRLPAFKDIPTLSEAGYEIPKTPQLRGVVGPPNMPADVLAYYESLIEKVVKTPAWQKYLEENHFEGQFQKSAETRKFLDTFDTVLRDQLKEIGAKVVR